MLASYSRHLILTCLKVLYFIMYLIELYSFIQSLLCLLHQADARQTALHSLKQTVQGLIVQD